MTKVIIDRMQIDRPGDMPGFYIAGRQTFFFGRQSVDKSPIMKKMNKNKNPRNH